MLGTPVPMALRMQGVIMFGLVRSYDIQVTEHSERVHHFFKQVSQWAASGRPERSLTLPSGSSRQQNVTRLQGLSSLDLDRDEHLQIELIDADDISLDGFVLEEMLPPPFSPAAASGGGGPWAASSTLSTGTGTMAAAGALRTARVGARFGGGRQTVDQVCHTSTTGAAPPGRPWPGLRADARSSPHCRRRHPPGARGSGARRPPRPPTRRGMLLSARRAAGPRRPPRTTTRWVIPTR